MREDTGDWPGCKRAGWPPEPKRDGLYVLGVKGAVMTLLRYWSATHELWSAVKDWPRGMTPDEAKVLDFMGEVLSHDQIQNMKNGGGTNIVNNQNNAE